MKFGRFARAVRGAAAASIVGCGTLLASCGGGSIATTPVGTPTTSPNAVPASFSAIGGAPTTLSSSSRAVAVPPVPGVPTVGGNLTLTATTPVTTVVSVAPVSSAAGGPPVALLNVARRAVEDFTGAVVTTQYYVGLTNTTATAAQVNLASLTLGVNVPAGSSAALAVYDPSLPQNAWNQRFAFGTQVSTNGTQSTFAPAATLTLYPGATLWLAPYTYPSNAVAPTPAPSAGGIVPTPAPAPASLTGTYVGTTNEGGVSSNLTFTLSQSGSSITGTFTKLPSGPSNPGSTGTITGTVTGGRLTLTATDSFGDACTNALTATASGTLISGSYVGQPPCSGSGIFSATLQTATLPILSGTYTGTIVDGGSGTGTLRLTISTPGSVFNGTGSPTFPSALSQSGTDAIVGFVTSATTASFAVINGSNVTGGTPTGTNCSPFGTFTISGNTLNGSYSNSGSNTPAGGCSATGTFSISR